MSPKVHAALGAIACSVMALAAVVVPSTSAGASTLSASTLASDESFSAPTGLREYFDANRKSIGIAWKAPTGRAVNGTYNIYADGRLIIRGGSPALWSYLTDVYYGGLSCSTTYTFVVQAFDLQGNLSLLSRPLKVTTPSTTPSGLCIDT